MHIVLGITGSIAAYKACTLIREFVKRGHEVQVVITPAGKEFITPITLSALTSKPVVSEFFSGRDGTWNSHVDLGLWADAMVIAPATANTLAKMAHGIADNMLLTTYLSMKAPVFVAPAMDLDMWAHAATQENMEVLRQRGVVVIEPQSGELASHLVGKGRMEEPEAIAQAVLEQVSPAPATLSARRILITAGPTYERIDPVRFVGNYSSGKMGINLALECARRGAEVELVCGPVAEALLPKHRRIHLHHVESAAQMWETAHQTFTTMDAAILCAAVADFAPAEVAEEKIKREDDDLVLRLHPTQDIAKGLGEMKRQHNAAYPQHPQVLVGFALETCDEEAHALAKLQRKNLDFIVLNSMRDAGAGFGVDTNKITIISSEGEIAFPLKNKADVAADIVDALEQRL